MFNKKSEQAIDQEMNIETTGLVEWPSGVNLQYFRTESTSYKDLERFIDQYDLQKDSHLVDYGSGKGRIVFYLNYILDLPTSGVEVSEEAFSYLEDNYENYQEKYPNKAEDISLIQNKAEDYSVKESDNIFYFFNPFTVNVFGEVIEQIEESLKQHPRVADIILYYPGVAYAHYLELHSSFDLIQVIKMPKYFLNNRECFKIFRHFPDK